MTADKNKIPETGVAVIEKTAGERFTAMVFREFGGIAGAVKLTDFQKRLVQNYFISVDQTLKALEEKRLKKSDKYRDALSLSWDNLNMPKLALDVVAAARVGLDPAQVNHINVIPYKNSTTNKYDIGFIVGYRGKELIATKYGLDVPDDIIVELVYSTDKFTPHKKDMKHEVETYDFEIVNSFSRGEIIGGFYYYSFIKEPQKNKLMMYSKADIEKRKPRYASPEFWGGEKEEWEGGQKTGKKEKVEGWYPEMMWKTVCRMAYGNITIDSQKIDDAYTQLSINQKIADNIIEDTEERSQETIHNNANKGGTISITAETVDSETIVVQEKKEELHKKDGAGF